jgi:hypothetical protein
VYGAIEWGVTMWVEKEILKTVESNHVVQEKRWWKRFRK